MLKYNLVIPSLHSIKLLLSSPHSPPHSLQIIKHPKTTFKRTLKSAQVNHQHISLHQLLLIYTSSFAMPIQNTNIAPCRSGPPLYHENAINCPWSLEKEKKVNPW